MQRIAEALHERLSSQSKMSSYERRLQRLIDNEDINVTDWWERFLQHTLPHWDTRRATLVLDCTPYNESFTIVFVGILHEKRLLPLAWEIMPQTEKWEEGQWSIVDRLFGQVAQFLHAPSVTLLADRGLTALPLIQLCQRYHWHYLLRIQNDEYCRRRWHKSYRDWQRGCDFLLKKGTSWYGEILLWKTHGFACTLSACWDPECEEAWFKMLRSASLPKTGPHVRITHAGRSHISRHQEPPLVYRKQPAARCPSSQPMAVGHLSLVLVDYASRSQL